MERNGVHDVGNKGVTWITKALGVFSLYAEVAAGMGERFNMELLYIGTVRRSNGAWG